MLPALATERKQLFQFDLDQNGDKRLAIMATSVVPDALLGSREALLRFSGRQELSMCAI
jgi:hypothetical protein